MRTGRLSLVVALSTVVVPVLAWGEDPPPPPTVFLANPNWNITLSPAGYADVLFDNTPGFEGREYLSGEWAAAVSYSGGKGGGTVSPTWLEKEFLFPDWTTNSNFTYGATPFSNVVKDAQDNIIGATSTISNPDLRVDIRYEMVDTVTGMKIGTVAASSPTGGALDSNRYVLKQTYTVTNISGATITRACYAHSAL